MKNVVLLFSSLCTLSLGLFIGSYYYSIPFTTPYQKAIAVIHPTKNNTVQGVVTFTHQDNGLLIEGTFKGLPQGEHGFHIHEFGNCACDDAVCAGDHFNPTNEPHGSPMSEKRHHGDLGNIVADQNGNATYSFVDTKNTLNGVHSIIGRSVIIHAQCDDFTTQPTGNSGARIGAGVIGITKKQ